MRRFNRAAHFARLVTGFRSSEYDRIREFQ